MKGAVRGVKRVMALALSVVLVGVAGSLPDRVNKVPLRVAVGLWPGSETLLMARERGMLPESRFTLLEATWPSVAYRAFDSGAVDAAVLTGAGVSRLLLSGKNVRVVCFMDESRGADALVALGDVRNLADLKGKKVGLAPHGPGYHLLTEALVVAGLKMDDVEEVSLLPTEISGALLRGEVSAVVAAEPWVRVMVAGGAHVLIDSSELKIPGLRLLVVKESVLLEQREELVDLVRAHFAMIPHLLKGEEGDGMAVVLQRQRMSGEEFAEVMSNIRIFDRGENRVFLEDGNPAMSEILNPSLSEGEAGSSPSPGSLIQWSDASIVREVAP